jgi:hypothetical protein
VSAGLKPVILATQELRSRGSRFKAKLGQIVFETLSRKNLSQKKGLVEWLRMKALSSSPSSAKKKKKRKEKCYQGKNLRFKKE